MDEGLYFTDPNESLWVLKPAKDAITILQEERRKDSMNEALREAIGGALYEASMPLMDDDEPTWDEIADKEIWIQRAEKVVEAHRTYIYVDIKRQLGIKDEDERRDV